MASSDKKVDGAWDTATIGRQSDRNLTREQQCACCLQGERWGRVEHTFAQAGATGLTLHPPRGTLLLTHFNSAQPHTRGGTRGACLRARPSKGSTFWTIAQPSLPDRHVTSNDLPRFGRQ